MALTVGKGIVLPFLRPRHWSWGWGSAPCPGCFTPGKDPVPIVNFESVHINIHWKLKCDILWMVIGYGNQELNTEHHSKQIRRIQTLQNIVWWPVVYSGQNSTNKVNVNYWCLFEWKAQNFTLFNERFSRAHIHTRVRKRTSHLEGVVDSAGFCKTYIFIKTVSLKCKEMNHQLQIFFIFFFSEIYCVLEHVWAKLAEICCKTH